MELDSQQIDNVEEEEEEEEEYVLLDLDSVYEQIEIPPNAPYVLSGLDTLNPVLIIGDDIKLIGEYEETIGTCYIFTETEGTPLVHEETGPSEENLFMGISIEDPNQVSGKEVKPITSLQKILKFRLALEDKILGRGLFMTTLTWKLRLPTVQSVSGLSAARPPLISLLGGQGLPFFDSGAASQALTRVIEILAVEHGWDRERQEQDHQNAEAFLCTFKAAVTDLMAKPAATAQ